MCQQAKVADLTFTLNGSATADENEVLLYNSETYVSESLIW
jgi:hypothetical protein